MRQYKYGLIVPLQIDHHWCDPHAATTEHKTSLSSTSAMSDQNGIFEITFTNCLVVRKASSGPIDILDDVKSKFFSLLDSQNFRSRPSKILWSPMYYVLKKAILLNLCLVFIFDLILCLDFIFDLVFGFHGCSIKYLGVWMVSRDCCLKVDGSHKHSTAIVLESKTK